MAAGATYVPIATTTLGSSTQNITFSSIPSTYTDLVVVYNIIATGSPVYGNLSFNGDNGNNYSTTFMSGDGSSTDSNRQSNNNVIANSPLNISSGTTTLILNVMNYSNTTTYKTVLGRTSNTSSYAFAEVGLWRSTAAITSINIYTGSANSYLAGTTATLFGIAAA